MSIIQNIFMDHADEYLERFGNRLPKTHRKAISAICECRSGERGIHLFECPECGEKHATNSSCGNRHCPVCQNDKASQWVYKQQLRLLPCNYFLSTFTLPEELRAIARSYQQQVYDAMFTEAAASLKTLEADPRFVGCNISGFFGVLHTWGRQLQYHPHVHFVIPGGGLNEDKDEWIAAHGQFLVNVKALSKMFRGKMRAAFKEAGLLSLVSAAVWNKDWVVHCKPVGDGRHIMKYLGAYVFRVAISDARIVSYNGSEVTFKYQKVGSPKWRKMTLSVMEFIRRFLQHVLPHGFMKIRHFGFLCPNFSVSLQRIREYICVLYELLQSPLKLRRTGRNTPVKVKPPKKQKSLQCKKCQTLMQWLCFIIPVRKSASP